MKISAATSRPRVAQLSLVLQPPPAPRLALPDLPPLVRARTLHQPYAGLVAAVPPGERVGLKGIETRGSRTQLGPLVICAGLAVDEEAMVRLLRRVPAWARPLLEVHGEALCLVNVAEVRPLVPEDEPLAWFYAPGRHAWVLDGCWPFKTPFKQRGWPGEFKVERERILEALAPR